MDDALREMLLIMASYVGMLVISFGIMNWAQAGKLIPFMKVKLSMGRKILVHIRTITHDYYKVGEIIEKQLVFSDKSKNKRRLDILNPNCIYRASGVNNIVVDDADNTIFTRKLDSTKGFDAIKNEHLHIRCMYAPKLNSKTEKIIIGLLVVLLLVGLATAYFGYQNNELLTALELANNQAQVIV